MSQILLNIQSLQCAIDLSKIDEVGIELLHIGQHIGYWITVIVAVFQIIKASACGDRQKVLEIILMALIVYGALFIVPYALDLISGVFNDDVQSNDTV